MTTVTTCDNCGKTVPEDEEDRVCVAANGIAVHVAEMKYEHDLCAACKQDIITTGTWMDKKDWLKSNDDE